MLSDFPPGWVQSDKASPGAKCPSVESAKKATSGHAKPPEFDRGENDVVTNAVYIYPTVAEAQRGFSALSGSETRACLANSAEQAAKKSAPEGVKFGQASTGQLSARPIGDESTAGRVTIPYTVGIVSFTLSSDLQFVRVGRGIQVLSFITAPGTFDSGLKAKLTRTATDRLKAQLAHSRS
jgi:hypothetical protein